MTSIEYLADSQILFKYFY